METDTRWLCGKCNTFNPEGKGCEVGENTTESWEIAYMGNTGLMEKQTNKEVNDVSAYKTARRGGSAQNEQWRHICQDRID